MLLSLFYLHLDHEALEQGHDISDRVLAVLVALLELALQLAEDDRAIIRVQLATELALQDELDDLVGGHVLILLLLRQALKLVAQQPQQQHLVLLHQVHGEIGLLRRVVEVLSHHCCQEFTRACVILQISNKSFTYAFDERLERIVVNELVQCHLVLDIEVCRHARWQPFSLLGHNLF